jgi:hypothetical protein
LWEDVRDEPGDDFGAVKGAFMSKNTERIEEREREGGKEEES